MVQLLNDVMDVMSMEDVVVIKTRASLLLHDMLRNFPECGHVLSDDFEESTIPRELTESDLRDITKMTNVLGVVFKDHILTRRRMLNRKVDQFFKGNFIQVSEITFIYFQTIQFFFRTYVAERCCRLPRRWIDDGMCATIGYKTKPVLHG